MRPASLLAVVAFASIAAISPSLARAQQREETPAPPPAIPADLDQEIDTALRRSTLGTFWGAVMVSRDGVPLVARGYGDANEELAPITADTLFDIGSVTKQFTAAAVLRLEMDGKLSLDDPASKFFPVGPQAEKITVRHLLHHTSGLTDQRAIQRLDFADRDEAVKRALTSRPNAEPGAAFDYCNAGYIVLAAIIEKASGQTYEDYLREHIFRPAGLTNTGFLDGKGLDPAKATVRATGQQRGGGRRLSLFASSTGEPWAWGLRGAGGVLTTLSDLAKWDHALSGDAVLSARARATLFTPDRERYACGWFVSTCTAGQRDSHTGGTRGFTAAISRFPEAHLFTAVLSNESHNPEEIERMLIEALFPAESARISALLTPPAGVLNEYRGGDVSGPAQWLVSRDTAGVACVLRVKDAQIARIVLPLGRAQALSADLAELAPMGGPGDATVMFGLGPYPDNPAGIALPEHTTIRVQAQYVGSHPGGQTVDQRPTLVLVDDRAGYWPLIVRMDRSVAGTFAAALEQAAAPPAAP